MFSNSNEKFWHQQTPPIRSLTELTALDTVQTLQECFTDPDTAFERGIFQPIQTASIDLPKPRPLPSPSSSKVWIDTMPPDVQATLFTNAFNTLHIPLQQYVSAAPINGIPLPLPRFHGDLTEYPQLLQHADTAGMLNWTVVSSQDANLTEFQDSIQMTMFAISKSPSRNRLISWPRLQNQVLPDPPHVSLPDPSLFDAVQTSSSTNRSAFYLDIENMFHNITLPLSLSYLFPMKAIPLNHLHPTLANTLRTRLNISPLLQDVLLRPFQATMPMGFKWSVYIAHTFANACIQQAYHLFRMSRFAPPALSDLMPFQREYSPFKITRQQPLILHIIDDIVFIAEDWPDAAVTCWYRILRKVFTLHHLPVSDSKSSSLQQVEKDSVKFIGCIWNLRKNLISPDPAKVHKTVMQVQALLASKTTLLKKWQRVLGRLVWLAMLNRPLLSCTRTVFRTQLEEQTFTITPQAKMELHMLTSLIPLASVTTSLPIFSTILAYDASLQAGAVVYARVQQHVAEHIWQIAKYIRHNPEKDHHTHINTLLSTIHTFTWTKALVHYWRSPHDHINGLEASAALLALEWAARSAASTSRLTLITDSTVVQGALHKGRSSSLPLGIRCKRFAAICLASQLSVVIAHVPSEHNPADPYTRLPAITRSAEQH